MTSTWSMGASTSTTRGTVARRARRQEHEEQARAALLVRADDRASPRAIADDATTANVAALPSERDMSRWLRRWLRKAGVTRSELFAGPPRHRDPVDAVRGDDPLKIMQRAGHTDFATTQPYVREAEAVRGGFGEEFPSLPAAMLGSDAHDSKSNRSVRRRAVQRGVRGFCAVDERSRRGLARRHAG